MARACALGKQGRRPYSGRLFMADTPDLAGASSPWRAEIAATLWLSWPLALANLLQMLTYAVDVIFIARLGEEPLAASALVVSVFGLIMWALSSMTGMVAAVISAELGARAPALRPVRRATRMALWLAVLSGAGRPIRGELTTAGSVPNRVPYAASSPTTSTMPNTATRRGQGEERPSSRSS